MGWKAANIFITDNASGDLSIFPKNDSQRCKEIIQQLGLSQYQFSGISSLDDALYPEHNHLHIGSYSGLTVLGSWSLIEEIFDNRKESKFLTKLLTVFSTASILAVTLLSSNNTWGYAYFEHGKLVRFRVGDADSGTIVDEGTPLKLELPLLAQSRIENGQRIYALEGVEYTEDQVGENFVFALCTPFLGTSLDRYDSLKLEMDVYISV